MKISASYVASGLLFGLLLVGIEGIHGQSAAISADGIVESTMGGFMFPDGTIQLTAVGPGVAPIEQTGQQSCFNAAGSEIACAGTGQDGDHRAGVAWPEPRLVDNGDGTVTDHLTGLVWLQLTDCFGLETWEQALASAAALSSGVCGLLDGSQAGDWRLPNFKELVSLVDYGQRQPVLPEGHPFAGLSGTDLYWSSSFVAREPQRVWAHDFRSGEQVEVTKSGFELAWPVRGPS